MRATLLFLLFLAPAIARSELLLFQRAGGEGQPPYNQITVPANQVVFLTWFRQGQEISTMEALLVADGRTNRARLTKTTSIPEIPIVGPAKLLFTNACAIQYHAITNTGLSTFVITNGQSFAITIPDGKTLRLLPSALSGAPSYATFSIGTNSLPNIVVDEGDEFPGPLTINFDHPQLAGQSITYMDYTYYFIDPSITLPTGVALQAGTGSVELRVEKSNDFQHWTPSIIQPLKTDQKSFYRLYLSR